eukprot:12887816-Prorocentrum_lima.AAC.1
MPHAAAARPPRTPMPPPNGNTMPHAAAARPPRQPTRPPKGNHMPRAAAARPPRRLPVHHGSARGAGLGT